MNKRIVWGVTAVLCAALMVRCAVAESTQEPEETTVQAATVPEPVDMVLLSVPDGDTSFKAYMDWETITNTRSEQYAMQQQAYTDSAGLRRYKTGEYMIALGSYYGEVGDRFVITLDSGKTFHAVMGDLKADRHTDASNRYTPMEDGMRNVVEFIVDVDELPDTTRQMGDISYDGFGGSVERIERME